MQIVVLLYLIDNNDNTSWMILMGSGMGVIIEAWKVGDKVSKFVDKLSSLSSPDYQSGRHQCYSVTSWLIAALQTGYQRYLLLSRYLSGAMAYRWSQ